MFGLVVAALVISTPFLVALAVSTAATFLGIGAARRVGHAHAVVFVGVGAARRIGRARAVATVGVGAARRVGRARAVALRSASTSVRRRRIAPAGTCAPCAPWAPHAALYLKV
jgi:hypothetical protein